MSYLHTFLSIQPTTQNTRQKPREPLIRRGVPSDNRAVNTCPVLKNREAAIRKQQHIPTALPVTEQEQRWIEAWRIAGPELERIRDQELRSLDDVSAIKLLGGTRSNSQETNGLAVFQA